MKSATLGLVSAIALAFPAAAAAQGADLGYGGLLGEAELVPQQQAPPPAPPGEVPAPPAEVPVLQEVSDFQLGPGETAVAPTVEVPAAAPPVGVTAAPEGEGALPVTGRDLLGLAIAGMLLVAMGAALRRRSQTNV